MAPKEERPPVIMTCFAGRRENMEILLSYTDDLHSQGLLDEFHIWDFSRSKSDQEWLSSNFKLSGRKRWLFRLLNRRCFYPNNPRIYQESRVNTYLLSKGLGSNSIPLG